jgi:hypothetical protein
MKKKTALLDRNNNHKHSAKRKRKIFKYLKIGSK